MVYNFQSINEYDINNLASSMLEAFLDTEDFEGETLEELNEEINSIIKSTFGIFISDASFQIKKNDDTISAILISLYKGKPLVSELFTKKKFKNLGFASNLLKKKYKCFVEIRV